jgi:hypothetical protein
MTATDDLVMLLRVQLVGAHNECEKLRAALARLVEAKDEKDRNGDTARYRTLKAGAWEGARAVLERTAPR